MDHTATLDASAAATQTMMSPETVDNLVGLTQNSIYLMGAAFVLGSLFTLFLLLILDFVRRGKGEKEF
jgi:hypothetical protein